MEQPGVYARAASMEQEKTIAAAIRCQAAESARLFVGVTARISSLKLSQVCGMKKLSEFERGYIAGIIDCDGNIEIERRQIRIRVSNTNHELLERIQQVIGGKIYEMSPSDWKDRRPRKSYYTLQICKNRDVVEVLSQIINDLVDKHDIAEEALRRRGTPPEKLRPPVTLFICDYDLPANNSRRRFYRRIQRWLKANGTDETAAWSTQSVVITTDRDFAEFVYQEASRLGHANLYKAEKIK